jgi:hypothetical protein
MYCTWFVKAQIFVLFGFPFLPGMWTSTEICGKRYVLITLLSFHRELWNIAVRSLRQKIARYIPCPSHCSSWPTPAHSLAMRDMEGVVSRHNLQTWSVHMGKSIQRHKRPHRSGFHTLRYLSQLLGAKHTKRNLNVNKLSQHEMNGNIIFFKLTERYTPGRISHDAITSGRRAAEFLCSPTTCGTNAMASVGRMLWTHTHGTCLQWEAVFSGQEGGGRLCMDPQLRQRCEHHAWVCIRDRHGLLRPGASVLLWAPTAGRKEQISVHFYAGHVLYLLLVS